MTLSGTNSLFTAMLRQPVSFAILVLSVVILIVWFDYKSTLKQMQPNAVSQPVQSMPSAPTAIEDSSPSQPLQLSPPGSQPGIMSQFGSGANSSGAPAIDTLVGGLEAKVKADPGNLNNRLLLAQTYKELGRQEDATQELRNILKQDPSNARADLILASILSQSDDQKELQESLQLLAKIPSDAPIQPYMIDLYRGDALSRQNNTKDALKNWKQALATMPKSDARYANLEKKVMDLGKGKSAAAGS
jgi:predicted negative regulator of RcsB-dependent stress response